MGVNFLLPFKYRNYWLLFGSLFFYAWGAPQFVFILLGSVLINFFLVKRLNQSVDNRYKKPYLVGSIIVNLGLLLYFKYANFFIENVSKALENVGFSNIEWTEIALPIGISFFTFQSLTYTVDVYRKVHKPLNNIADYALYIMLFPQMIAGPIVRFSSVAEQLLVRSVNHVDVKYGLNRFIIGLSKKVLIANTLSEYASNTLFQNGGVDSSTTAWVGILAYTLQIYFDFSGYSDMAIGIGKMLGFTFPENFDNPYTSKSITEFWRRWHITLGTWMRDYLYIPLGGNRASSNSRLYFNLFFVFFISGLWHGASWNFVFWGMYHGVFLVVERLFLKEFLKKIPKFLSVLYAFIVVIIGWVFFSIDGLNNSIKYLEMMFRFSFTTNEILFDSKFVFTLIVALFFAFARFLPMGEWLLKQWFEQTNFTKKRPVVNLMSLVLLLLCFVHLVGSGFNPFIYFRF